ncbi:hypothetical protein FRC18_000900, partial [Serendipita sp. 400]
NTYRHPRNPSRRLISEDYLATLKVIDGLDSASESPGAIRRSSETYSDRKDFI